MLPLVLWLIFGLTVQGDTVCPTAAEVATRLAQVVPRDRDSNGVVYLSSAAGGVHIALYNRSGTQLAERELEGNACAELAQAAAVVIASWQAEIPTLAPA